MLWVIIMKWTSEAESAIKKVPFFVRKRVKVRVGKEAYDAGKAMITLAEEIPGIFSQDQILGIVQSCIALYKQHSNFGQRFAAILTDEMMSDIRASHSADVIW